MLTKQQKWKRYVRAINYIIGLGYFVSINETKNGNLKGIWVEKGDNDKSCYIPLKAKKYKPIELLNIVLNYVGYSQNMKEILDIIL